MGQQQTITDFIGILRVQCHLNRICFKTSIIFRARLICQKNKRRLFGLFAGTAAKSNWTERSHADFFLELFEHVESGPSENVDIQDFNVRLQFLGGGLWRRARLALPPFFSKSSLRVESKLFKLAFSTAQRAGAMIFKRGKHN